ncbi:transmembrane protease serine 12-like [Amphibalanus amphitrite]|nr:transmembrane protease serine 12-like [Amphibalanus amphitrite]
MALQCVHRYCNGVVLLLLLSSQGSAQGLAADSSLQLNVPSELMDPPTAPRHRRASDNPLDCDENEDICDIYSRAFQSLPGMRTSDEPTLRSVSRQTCATRCALRAPACRHFSYQSQKQLCILGCRPGSASCTPSGDLMKDSSWSFYFLSASRLASITNSVILALQNRAAFGGVEVRNISDALEGGRFGGGDLSVGAEPAIEKLFGSPGPRPAGGAAADMIANGRTQLLPTDCGRVPLSATAPAPVPSILGGEAAFPGQYPWQARILVREGHSYVHRCGGTIITDRHVLSAAHCLRDVSISRVEVRVGETDFDDLGLFSNSLQIFSVVNMKFHDSYLSDLAGGTFSNDIMMLQLRPSNGRLIKFDELVQPACVPRSGLEYQGLRPAQTLEPPLSCNVSGWGKTSREATVTSPVLRGVEIPLVSDSYCGSPEAYGRRFQSQIMFCAGFTDEGVNRDSCGGDSGGPLACPLLDSGLFAVYGVVSHSHPKGCGREPGMYTKVSYFTDWILSAVETQV